MIVRAYFFASQDALKSKAALMAAFQVTGPYVAEKPQNRRQIFLEVDMPTGLTQRIEPNLWSRLITLVQQYDGWVYDPEEARR